MNINVLKDGPLLITGINCDVLHADGTKESKQGSIALCRCGQSATKPFCDGSHKQGFKGQPIQLILDDNQS